MLIANVVLMSKTMFSEFRCLALINTLSEGFNEQPYLVSFLKTH